MSNDPKELRFSISARDESSTGVFARAGHIRLNGKTLDTPAFMPVGTLATVKSLSIQDLINIEAGCILGNTYHLHLRPGEEVIAELGGLHRFMGGWPGLILTDSGGYQVLSLARLRSLDENGVTFQAHTDGSTHVLTPESVVEIQQRLGSDIMMVLDECPPHTASFEQAAAGADRTLRWAERSAATWGGFGALFAISQGAMYKDLRRRHAQEIARLEFPGFAVGGLGIGEDKQTMKSMLSASLSELPVDRPRYLMGIGAPEDLVNSVAAGVDLFDCVLQTREARNGALLSRSGRVNINNARFEKDPGPIENTCDCSTCATYSRAYLHHLFRNKELLGYRLASIHNLRWTIRLMQEMRANILVGTFDQYRDEFLAGFQSRVGASKPGSGGPANRRS
ncbi:MAG TPA: tRNA guanosine(34) transglycosylase Tgt [Chloroflexota bacterium]|nr:tRNA guanosine(34) transglycosylase Tgt [Chloroflexota bacterium]